MRNIFFRKRRSPQNKNSSFYLRENIIQNSEDLKSLINKNISHKSTNNVSFQGLPLSEINIAGLTNFLGEESYILDNDAVISGHIVYFYRKETVDFKLIIQVHFIDNLFFFGSTKVSAEALLSVNSKKLIIKQLQNKFPDVELVEDCFDICISDQENNLVFTKDDVYFYINYLINDTLLSKNIRLFELFKSLTSNKVNTRNSFNDFI